MSDLKARFEAAVANSKTLNRRRTTPLLKLICFFVIRLFFC